LGGKVDILKKLPLLNMVPMVALYYATNGAEKVQFADDFIEYDFSPKSMRLIDNANEELLKPIKSAFAPI
jgi:hypothetical protein